MPRPKRHRKLQQPPAGYGFRPYRQNDDEACVQLLFEEYEAIRLADYKHLSQEEASSVMEVSRPTFTRIYDSARSKVARALVENLSLKVAGGHVQFEHEWYRCLDCDTTFRAGSLPEKEHCPVCHSSKLEHINGSLHLSVIQRPQNKESDEMGFCVCPACGSKQPHKAGIPCKSILCNKCKVHLIRENSMHHQRINQIKNQQNTNK